MARPKRRELLETADSRREPSSFAVRNGIGFGGERCDHAHTHG